jgi:rhodanese-related sulfurtransferase
MQVAAFLERQGFSNVINLTGGIHAWAQQVAPEMTQY